MAFPVTPVAKRVPGGALAFLPKTVVGKGGGAPRPSPSDDDGVVPRQGRRVASPTPAPRVEEVAVDDAVGLPSPVVRRLAPVRPPVPVATRTTPVIGGVHRATVVVEGRRGEVGPRPRGGRTGAVALAPLVGPRGPLAGVTRPGRPV